MTFAIQKSQIKSILPTSIRDILDSIIPFPEPKPSLVALLLLIGLWPGGIHTAWKIGSRSLIDPFCNGGRLFTQAVVSPIEILSNSSVSSQSKELLQG